MDKNTVRKLVKGALFVGAIVAPCAVQAADPTDIAGVVTAVSSLWDTIVPIGIGILMFGVGRSLVKRFAK